MWVVRLLLLLLLLPGARHFSVPLLQYVRGGLYSESWAGLAIEPNGLKSYCIHTARVVMTPSGSEQHLTYVDIFQKQHLI